MAGPGIEFPFGNVVERRRFPTSALSAGAAAGAALRGGIIFPALRYDRIGHCSPGTPSSHPPTRLGELNSRCEPSGGITARVDWTACLETLETVERARAAHIMDSVAAVTSQPSTSLCLFPDPTAWDDHQDHRRQFWRSNQGTRTQETGELSSVVFFFPDFSSFFSHFLTPPIACASFLLEWKRDSQRVVHAEEDSRPFLASVHHGPSFLFLPGQGRPFRRSLDVAGHGRITAILRHTRRGGLIGVADDFV